MVRLKYKKTTELYSSQLVMVRGLANGDIKEEILSMIEHISLEDAITFVSMGEPEVIEAANAKTIGFRNTPRGSRDVHRSSPPPPWPSVKPPRRRCCQTMCPPNKWRSR